MAIPVMPIPNVQVPNEPNPLLTGLQTGLQVYTGLMQAFAMPDEMKAKQQQQQAQLGLVGAQTNLANAQAQKLSSPSDQYQSSVGKMFADSEKVKSIYGSDSDEYKSMQDQIQAQLQKQQTMNDFYQTLNSSAPMRYATPLVKEQIVGGGEAAGQTPEQAQYTATHGGMNIDNGGMSNPTMTAQSPQDVIRSTQGSNQIQSQIQKMTTPENILNRQYAGARAGMTLDNMNQFIDQGALNYSGMAGKAALSKDQLTSALTGNVPPQLSAYRNFQGQLNVLKDEYATALGVPADQISRGELGSLFDVSQYSTNPAAAKQQLANVKSLLDKSEDINFTSLHDLAAKNRDIASKNERKDDLQVNPSDLQKASPKAAKQLGITQTQIPTFNSKAEFQTWYAQQSPAIQAAVRKKLGGQ